MYLRSVEIRNVRSIRKLQWECAEKEAAGWHVILGDNGAGKSTFLRALALALVGPGEALATRQDWTTWPTRGASDSHVRIQIAPHTAHDKYSGSGAVPASKLREADIVFDTANLGRPKAGPVKGLDPQRHIWGTGKGWFSAAYGPFRRFSGGNPETIRIFHTNPELGAHISIFGEDIALTESLVWLRDLRFKFLEKKPEGKMLPKLMKFINHPGLLPNRVRLESISSDGVDFIDSHGVQVGVEFLSDGFRSVLSMTFELIRQLSRIYSPAQIFNSQGTAVVIPGVVLIDEIDAHLHPTWQKRIGEWFTQTFPKFQFLVTTHSPLVCHAAGGGSIFKLGSPGSLEEGRFLTGVERDRLLYGDILDAYSTEAFGTPITRSADGLAKQQRLAKLNLKELRATLTSTEQRERAELRKLFPSASPLDKI
jgi:energy-coupling factor transporter ATP-binding protein EcfA2